MIEILGYITLYLIIGVVLLPFCLDGNSDSETKREDRWVIISGVLVWVVMFPIALIVIWLASWKELKNYK